MQRYKGGNQPRRMWQAVAQEEKVFSPWDLDESMEIETGLRIVEIETGLRIVKRKEGGRGGR